jgi:hypothetical protein
MPIIIGIQEVDIIRRIAICKNPISAINKLGVVECTSHPSYKESINRKITVIQASLVINIGSYPQNN